MADKKKKTTVGFVSLGCPKNRLDTEVMLKELIDAGYEITGEEIEADIIIINTCAFIESAKKESIDNILDIAWLKQKKLRGIIVTGCLSERYRDEIFKELPEVDAVLGVGSLHDIAAAVAAVDRGEKYSSYKPKDEVALGGERVVTTPDGWAYLKIAEGCDNCCSYCAIPSIRGHFRSRPMEELVAEAKGMEELGVKELTLVAQDTSRYGYDFDGSYHLAELIRAITDATNIPWIRLLYCYPDKITEQLISEFKSNPRLLPYIDLPIQHINDRILGAMNRHGDSALIKEVISKLRAEVPGIVIRTTAIVGFPGETEEEFEQLCEFVKEAKFERFGAFPYSAEEGTSAALLPDQIDEQVKQDRCDVIMKLQMGISEQYNEKMLGKTVELLCEGYDPVSEMHYGRSAADAPEIDGKIYFSASSPKKRFAEGQMIKVRITDTLDYDLIGEAL